MLHLDEAHYVPSGAPIAHDDSMQTDHELLWGLRCGLKQTQVREAHIITAVSGGPDSIALLRGLVALSEEFQLTLTVAHFNHRYRGAESDADALFVEKLGAILGLKCVVQAASVGSESVREASARQIRYQFLESVAQQERASVIATGHTLDDQIETVLHHVLRGTGVAGLQGIPRERAGHGARIVRPLLNVARTAVTTFLSAIGQEYRIDASNVDTRLTRNWLRHELLPLIRERFPHADEAIARLSIQAIETTEVVGWLGRELLSRGIVRDEPDLVELSISAWLSYPREAWRAALVQLWMDRGWPRQEMGYERWEEIARIAASDAGAVTLPGNIEARKTGNSLIIRTL